MKGSMLARWLPLLCIFCSFPARADSALAPGAKLEVGGHAYTVQKYDVLPYIDDDYTKRFRFDSFDNPKLKELRTRYHLDELIAPGRDEFDKQVLLMDWTHRQFKKFGKPSADAKGALEILQCIEQGHTFFCAQYAKVLVSTAASLGWIDRELALRRHRGAAKDGSTEHSVTEIWSNQHRKWVMLDPTSNMYLEKDGVPLNAYEIRQEWFYHDGKDLVFVIGKERKKYRKSDLPIYLGTYAGFGDLKVSPDELDKYGFIGYIPNTDLMNSGEDYAKMFITKDKLCDGTRWHVRTNPENPALEPYFPLNQASLSLTPQGDLLRVSAKTLTPNFREFQVRTDGKDWRTTKETLDWSLQPGLNRLEVRALNRFGNAGPVSIVELNK